MRARQEFVIGGYVPSTISRKAIGSLVLGVYDGDELRHVGRVGTGFTVAVAEDLFRKLDPMRVQSSPFGNRLSAEETRLVRYVRPNSWPRSNSGPGPATAIFVTPRSADCARTKPAQEIVREMRTQQQVIQTAAAKRQAHASGPDLLAGCGRYQGRVSPIIIVEVWRCIAPFVIDRPLALVRCPTGITGEHFFQKHAWKGLNRISCW